MTARDVAARGIRVEIAGAPRIDGLAFRRFDPDADFPAVAALRSASNRADGVDWLPTAESLRHEWAHDSGFDMRADALLAEVSGELVAVVTHDCRLRAGRVFHHLEPVVDPAWRRRGLGRALLRWAEARAAAGTEAGAMGPRELPHVLAGEADLEIEACAPFAAAAGYRVDGYGVTMLRDLREPIPDVPLADGLQVRPVAPEQHRQIWDADTEAFRDHRDPAVRTEADYERWFTSPEVDTALWEVAWDRDEVAGSVWNVVFEEENERLGIRRGWLEHVSVRRPWRRRGVASALIARSLRRLRDLGLDEAALGSDAENLTGAIRVYEALGFRRARTAAMYRKALPGFEGDAPGSP